MKTKYNTVISVNINAVNDYLGCTRVFKSQPISNGTISPLPLVTLILRTEG